MNEDIKVTFVIRKECESEYQCSEEMQLAFVACEQHRGGGLQAQWMKEEDIKQFEGLTKRDVFVLNEFGGELFEKLRTTKCLLVGPRCLSCCLTEGTAIPSGPEPVFTVAMRGLVVTASGMTKGQKETIKRKIQWMGGTYCGVLTEDTTHVVADNVLSDKYVKSIERGISVMRETWVEAVWKKSLEENINGASPEFNDLKLPPFFNLQITTSGISKKEKQNIMKLVSENGGIFTGVFQSEVTDIVVLTQDGVGSEKYKAAVEYGKACVLPSWVVDSASRGVALPMMKYRVTGASTSSPLAEHRVPDMTLNFSRITNLRPANNFIDESRACDVSTLSGKMKLSLDTRKPVDKEEKEVQEAFENLDMTTIKKAGPIFDGFCIWVVGPEGTWRERANAVISRCGGVRYSEASPRVTHSTCCGRAALVQASRALPHVPALSARWLLACLAAGHVVPEDEYLMDAKKASTPPRAAVVEPASPMSKRNLQLLRREPLSLAPPQPVAMETEPEPPQDDIVNHYLSQNLEMEPPREKTPEPPAAAAAAPPDPEPDITDDLDDESDIEQIFKGLSFQIAGLDEEAISEIESTIRGAGGRLVRRGATHVVVPLEGDDAVTGEHVVTVFWLKDCLSQSELVPIQYYHRPVKMAAFDPDDPPLKGVVASLSTYSGLERAFLDHLANVLGATTQVRFCRRSTSSTVASTHLVCPEPSGQKYNGARRWGLPAVTAAWLLAAAEQGQRPDEKEYLVQNLEEGKQSPIKEESTREEATKTEENETNKENTVNVDPVNAMLPPTTTEPPPRRSIASNNSTPKQRLDAGDVTGDMSPASRYIAMARQGLLADSQDTPAQTHHADPLIQGNEVRTPSIEETLSTPNLRAFSAETRRRLQALKRGEMPSDTVKTPVDPFEKTTTPDSAFGAALQPGSGPLERDARRRLWELVHTLPQKQPPPQQQTPLSEIRNRFLAQFNNDAAPTTPNDKNSNIAPRKLHLQDNDVETPPSKMARHSVNQSPGSSSISKTVCQNITKTDSPQSHSMVHQMSSAGQSINKSTIPASNCQPSEVNNTTESGDNDASKSRKSSLPAAVDAQLVRLSAVLSGRRASPRLIPARTKPSLPPPLHTESEPTPDSQPNTVGWDDSVPSRTQSTDPTATQPFAEKRFMLSSNVDNRDELIAMIEELGGNVCEGSETDPNATHLMCAMPTRSEKMLGSIAAGKWILHPSYIIDCHKNGAALKEEEYEWGNPSATLPALPPAERLLARAAHRWRVGRAGPGQGAGQGAGQEAGQGAGPFNGVVALVHAAPARRRLLSSLIVAGGGRAPNLEPPYTDESINVCFADVKRHPLSARDAAWLRSRRVAVCAPVLLSSYLTDDITPDPYKNCLPEFKY